MRTCVGTTKSVIFRMERRRPRFGLSDLSIRPILPSESPLLIFKVSIRTLEVGVSSNRSPLHRPAYPDIQRPAIDGYSTHRPPSSRVAPRDYDLRISSIRTRSPDSPQSAGTGAMSSLGPPPFGPPSIPEPNIVLRFYSRDPSPTPSTLPSIVTCQRRFPSSSTTATE